MKVNEEYERRKSMAVVWTDSGSAPQQRKSPRPITWVPCHVILALSLEAELLYFDPTRPVNMASGTVTMATC